LLHCSIICLWRFFLKFQWIQALALSAVVWNIRTYNKRFLDRGHVHYRIRLYKYSHIIDMNKQMNNPHETSRSVCSLQQICWHICSRSADCLQIIYRLSTDYLQNVCRISAEYLQNICKMSADLRLQNVSWIADVLQTVWNLVDSAEQMNSRWTADKKQTNSTNQMLFILTQSYTKGSVFLQQLNVRDSVDSYSDDNWNLSYFISVTHSSSIHSLQKFQSR